jgi:ABC-2 type transport system ATP-binding protein
MADRIGIINNGELVVVEDKHTLIAKLGRKQLIVHLNEPLHALPGALAQHELTLAADGRELVYDYDTHGERTGITSVLQDLRDAGIRFNDLHTRQTSLEEIFVSLVRERR